MSAVLRYTVIGTDGTVSFVGPGYFLKMLVAAASRNPSTATEMLGIAGEFDPEFAGVVVRALDEDEVDWPDETERPFRAGPDVEPRKTLEAARNGVVVFNLDAKRIVQVQNTYGELKRADRGRMRRNGRPVQVFYTYELPEDWAIVP